MLWPTSVTQWVEWSMWSSSRIVWSYDLSDDRVKLTIYGRVLDDRYFKVLCYHPELSLVDMEVLNQAQFGEKMSDDEASFLADVGFVKEAYDTPSATPSAKTNGGSKLTDKQIDVLRAIAQNVNITSADYLNSPSFLSDSLLTILTLYPLHLIVTHTTVLGGTHHSALRGHSLRAKTLQTHNTLC